MEFGFNGSWSGGPFALCYQTVVCPVCAVCNVDVLWPSRACGDGSQEVPSRHSSSAFLVARPPTDQVSDDCVQTLEWVGSVSGRRLRAGLIRGQQTAPEICSARKLVVRRTRTVLGARDFTVSSAVVWNSLPAELRVSSLTVVATFA